MIRAMLIKEFLLILRDKQALLALFVMPAIFILIMSLALKDAFNEDRALVSYSVIDKEKSALSLKLQDLLRENRLLNEQNVGSDKKIQFKLTIPEGYAETFTGKSPDEKLLQIEVAADVKQDFMALFKSQIISTLTLLRMDIIKANLKETSASSAQMLDAISFNEEDMMDISFSALDKDEKPNSTQQSVPTWIVFGMFFVVIPMSTIFISERKQNTLLRLLSMNISVSLLFAGKIIPYMLINQVQVWVMIAVGMFVVPLFGAEALTLEGSMTALMLVSLALSLSAIGLSMLIAVIVESVEQATTIGGIINILLGAIGGVMVPKFVMPDFMQTFSNISPMSWGLEGFLDVLLRREGIEAVLPEVFALTLFGILLLALAMMIFKIKARSGL